MAKLDRLLALTNDALELDRLMRARESAANQERVLAGRRHPDRHQANAKPEKTTPQPERILEPT